MNYSELEKALVSSGQAKTLEKAHEIVGKMQDKILHKNKDPEDILGDYGLEPDYVFDIFAWRP